MLPVLVLPLRDPDNIFYPLLKAGLPILKEHFGSAIVSIPASTRERQPQNVAEMQADPFYHVYHAQTEAPAGLHFTELYRYAAGDSAPEQVLHLCYPDRLTFALQPAYRDSFLADAASLHPESLPLIFHRSARAWETHPQNYRQLEGFVSRLGETLFGKTLDYGWCHLVVQAGELRQVMEKVSHPEISMVAEMVLQMQHHIHTRDVDWLAWEDPFILNRDPAELKAERESSLAETQKRLSYCLPMTEILAQFAMNGKK
ncbi:MAG: hypothetical protein CVU44_16920 [Chloroflexi bacterium HGW-Chloroflexi-6]|nr:MAG: hypothetical protein CVU44_16920 [Chloroflexi bacterium HGW-Chloroflexi-6]